MLNKFFKRQQPCSECGCYATDCSIHNQAGEKIVIELPFPKPEEPKSEFEAMYEQVRHFYESVMLTFDEHKLPITRDEVQAFLGGIVGDLRDIVEIEKRGHGLWPLPTKVNLTWCDIDELSPILRDSYEIEGTEILEDIKTELETWLSDQGYTAGLKSNVPEAPWERYFDPS